MKEELVLQILNEFERTSLCQKRNCEATIVPSAQTDDEFGLDASVFGTRTSNKMWARDDISMAAIKGGPCPPMMMRMNASARAMATRRYGVTAGPNVSEESSTEMDLSLKMNPTMKMNAITRGRGPIELLVGGEWKQCLSRARTLKNKQEGLEDTFNSRPESRQRCALKKSTVEIMRIEDTNGVGNANITRNVRYLEDKSLSGPVARSGLVN